MATSKFAQRPSASTDQVTKPRRVKPVQPIERVTAQQQYAEQVAQAQDEYLSKLGMPSERRRAVATVSALILGASSYYWGAQVTGWLMAAALTLTGSAFIAFLVGALGMLASFFSAWSLGSKAYVFVCDFDLEGAQETGRSIRDAASRKVSLVRGWFKPSTDHIAV